MKKKKLKNEILIWKMCALSYNFCFCLMGTYKIVVKHFHFGIQLVLYVLCNHFVCCLALKKIGCQVSRMSIIVRSYQERKKGEQLLWSVASLRIDPTTSCCIHHHRRSSEDTRSHTLYNNNICNPLLLEVEISAMFTLTNASHLLSRDKIMWFSFMVCQYLSLFLFFI